MTKEDTVKVLLELQRAYPLFYSNKTAKDFSAIAAVWHKHIGKYESEVVNRAVDIMIDEETAVPTIALLKKYIPVSQEIVRKEAEGRKHGPAQIERLAR